MVKTYKCWNVICPTYQKEGRLSEDKLIKVKQKEGHNDFTCPACGKVIICEVEDGKGN